MGGIVIDGQRFEVPGIEVRNFLDDGVLRFKHRDRTGPVNEIVVHESVTETVGGTERVLDRKGYGVHLMVGPDGSVANHNDLARDRLIHAGGHNGPSVGIEIVNPYYSGKILDEGDDDRDGMWRWIIRAAWAHKGWHVVPTPEQLESVTGLIRFLTSPAMASTTIKIPCVWRGFADGKMAMSRIPNGDDRIPGIYAHTYFGHADGAFAVLYAFLRIARGFDPTEAFARAMLDAPGPHRSVSV